MSTKKHDHHWDDESSALLSGLARLAQDLDAQQFPGTAWPVAQREDSRPRAGKRAWRVGRFLVPLAVTAAAAVAAAVWVLPAFQGRPPESMPGIQQPAPQVARLPAPQSGEQRFAAGEQRFAAEESAPPQIVVVEDMDSYSIIDLTAGEPVVSFGLKDSSGPAYPLPVLPEPPLRSQPAGEEI